MSTLTELCDISTMLAASKEFLEQALQKVAEPAARLQLEQVYTDGNQLLLQHQADLQATLELLCDAPSKVQFLNFVAFKLLRKVNYDLGLQFDQNMPAAVFKSYADNFAQVITQNGLTMPQLSLQHADPAVVIGELVSSFALQQYRYAPHVDVTTEDVFIDCGSYIGDTVLWALQKGAQVHAFEPIPETFKLLKHNLQQNGFSPEHCHNFGVSSQNQEVVFKVPHDRADSSFLPFANKTPYQQGLEINVGTVDVPVRCVSLDSYLSEQGIKPSFIKMDIEGTELDALHGAAQTIQQHRPKLAICLYHRDEDLWTIPLFIKSLVPDYKFYCRENNVGFEFVLYACP